MRCRISKKTWEQVKVAYASGVGLREIGRNMGIPQGTVLARASREGWTRRIDAAKSLAKAVEPAILSTCDAAAVTMQERGARHVYLTDRSFEILQGTDEPFWTHYVHVNISVSRRQSN